MSFKRFFNFPQRCNQTVDNNDRIYRMSIRIHTHNLEEITKLLCKLNNNSIKLYIFILLCLTQL